jgi:metallo-beta-lactamase class B
MKTYNAQHPATTAATGPETLSYGGGIDGIGVTSSTPKVYLVFWGSQWGTQGTDGAGNVTLSGDTNGGAPYIQEHYHPHIYMSGPDWDYVQLVPPPAQQTNAPPKVDQFVVDGQPIVFGDEKVTPVLIPGHTPGSLGLIFPVKEGGKTHMVGIVGGGMLPQGTPDQMTVFLHSLAHFEEWTKRMKVDVELQNHPIMDGFAAKLAALQARKPGDPNPFIVGQENYSKFVEVMYTCVQVYIDRHID